MTESTELMTIGEFSNLARISVRMLRHYDASGVLVPADVDPFTGYRRYDASQLADAAAIRTLRDIGFGVSSIAALLPARGTPAWTSALELQREVLARELTAAQGRLTLLHRILTPEESSMSISLERRIVPAMTVLALRGTVPTYSDEGDLWAVFLPHVREQGISPIGPCGVIEHDAEYTEHDVDLSIFFPVEPGTQASEPFVMYDLPERDCVIARVLGPYDQISAAHDAISQRIAADGVQAYAGESLAGKGFNLYLTTPGSVPNDQLITEVCVPVR